MMSDEIDFDVGIDGILRLHDAGIHKLDVTDFIYLLSWQVIVHVWIYGAILMQNRNYSSHPSFTSAILWGGKWLKE